MKKIILCLCFFSSFFLFAKEDSLSNGVKKTPFRTSLHFSLLSGIPDIIGASLNFSTINQYEVNLGYHLAIAGDVGYSYYVRLGMPLGKEQEKGWYSKYIFLVGYRSLWTENDISDTTTIRGSEAIFIYEPVYRIGPKTAFSIRFQIGAFFQHWKQVKYSLEKPRVLESGIEPFSIFPEANIALGLVF